MAIIGKIYKSVAIVNDIYQNYSIKDAIKSQYKTLEKLLSKAEDTQFGKYYQFKSILKSKQLTTEFAQKVPVFDYDSIYEKWWSKAYQQEPNVCWPGKVKYFALSSGTSGTSSKKIPITKDMLQAIRMAGLRQYSILRHCGVKDEFFEKRIMMLGGSTHLNKVGNVNEGDLSGILTGTLPAWLNYFYKPGKQIANERDWHTKLDLIAKHAPDWDIGVIAGVPSWVQMLIERVMEVNQATHIHDIWPNFKIYVSGGVSFEPFENGFKKLLGNDILLLETYLASEGFIAFENKIGKKTMKLVLSNGIYFEFIPFNEQNFDEDGNVRQDAEVINLEKVQEGIDYALLISTCAGTWRYLIGDTIKFTSVKDFEIIITGRTKQYLSLCGEHLSIDNMNKAINYVVSQLNITNKEFTVEGIKNENEIGHHWYIGVEEDVDVKKLKELLDEQLKKLNDDYATERKYVLNKFQVTLLPNKIFYDWMENYARIGGQNKFPRVLKGEKLANWKSFLKENNLTF
jgi:hypothetical protein